MNRRFFLITLLSAAAVVIAPMLRKLLGTGGRNHSEAGALSVAHLYLAKNGTPQQNVTKVMEMMGGIQKFIGPKDVVLLKPNCQWWNQGRTNLAAMKGFIDLVLGIPGFEGEIIIGENHHFMDDSLPGNEKDNIRGWTQLSDINGEIDEKKYSMNGLVELYHQQGYKNVSKVHWRDGGPKHDDWGNGQNGGIISSPADGDGYIWSDETYTFSVLMGLKKWKVKMTYPVFTSPYSGVGIDFKNGVFARHPGKKIEYLKDQRLKFINFPVLNDHGKDTGITSAIKNYMGITDLSCGDWGVKPEGYYNVHACGGRYYKYAKAGPLGHFMKTIRKADLNIVTADWVGWGHRTDVSKATQCKTIVASNDPIALDYYGAKYLLYPLSRNQDLHDPDYKKSSARKFLDVALEALGEGVLAEKRMSVHEYDFAGHKA